MRPSVVLANGCWDLFHPGHLFHLKAAKALGDVLVVSITADEHVNKGPHRPVFPQDIRREVIKSLVFVDRTIIVENALEALRRIRPQIFVKGYDYQNAINPEHAAYCSKHGIRIAFTNEPTYSSSALLRYYENRYEA